MNGKTKISFSLAAAIAIACLGLTTQVKANQINGAISFSSADDPNDTTLVPNVMILNNSSMALATAVSEWGYVTVDQVVGDFVPFIQGDDVITMPDPWTFISPQNLFWSVGGFKFDLTSSVVKYQDDDGIVIKGKGLAYGNGFSATPATISLSINKDGIINFSATSSAAGVPDAGTTLMLLGMGMLGLGTIRRKLA